MKIIGTSNFNLETVDDILIQENLTEEIAIYKCNQLNKKQTEHSTYLYRVVEDNYKLYKASDNY